MHRLAIASVMVLSAIGCGSANTPGQVRAEAIARKWVASQGHHDPDEATYRVEPRNGGWSILIEYQPTTPGSHTALEIDASGRVAEVHPGA
jgi:hypothetical protein